jgi:large subunit ribosomal protein L29
MTKAKELQERTAVELTELEATTRRDLFKTRFSNFTNQLDDTAKLKRLRREIARIKTILTQKSRSGAGN